MTLFFTSDPHFWHKRICEFANRPFSSLEEMNETLIRNYNSVVMPDDECYFGGDFSFGTADQTESILRRLSGKKYLIRGNHDEKKNTLSDQCSKYFEWIKDYYELTVKDPDRLSGERILVMCHYPLLTWNGAHKVDKNNEPKSYMIHGHCHSGVNYLNDKTTRLDVGVDNNCNYTPFSYEQIKQRLRGKSYDVIDHHGKSTDYRKKNAT